MRLKQSILLLTLCLCSHASIAGSQTDSKQLSQARQIWEQAIVAKGGRERLESVRSIFISQRSKYWHGLKKYEVFTEELTVFPGKSWLWTDYRPDVFGLTVEMYNFERSVKCFSNADVPPPQPHAISGYETVVSHTYGLLGYLMETKWLKPKVIGVDEATFERRNVDVVHTMLKDEVEGFLSEDLYIDFSIDRQTHLPVEISYSRMKYGEKGSWNETILSGYVDLNGIEVPLKETIDGVTDRIRVQLNVEYDEELFSKPPSIAAGPEAWRVKKSR
jgi:hypothetical protein